MSWEENNKLKFELIRKMLDKLEPARQEFLRNYLVAFYDKFTQKGSIYLRMYDYLTSNKEIDYESFEKEIFADLTVDAQRKNLERFRDKAYESLLLDVNVNRASSNLGELEKAIIESKKLIIKGRMAIMEGLEGDLIYFLNKATKLSKRYELYEDLIESLQLLRNVYQVKGDLKKDKAIKNETQHYMKCRDLYSNAIELRTEVIKLKTQERVPRPLISKYYEQLNELLIVANELKSATVYRQLYYAKLNLDGFLEDWESAFQDCKFLEELIMHNPAVYRKRELGTVKLNLSIFSILTRQFSTCEKSVLSTLDYFPEGTIFYVSAMEVLFFAQYYQGKLDNASETTKWLLANEKSPSSDMQKSKWNYWNAAVQFSQANYKGCLSSLDSISEITKDKEGWNLWIRMLRILSYVELNMFEVADNETENFRRYTEGKSLPDRFQFGLKLILSLQRSAFNFEKIWKKQEKKILRWREENAMKFKIQSPELILIDQWLEAKATQVPFVQTF